MMSIWTRWPCLMGLSTSLQNIITVSKYSLPLIIIVGTLSECWSIVVIFAYTLILSLYQPSVGLMNLLLIYSCCLLIEKTFGAVIWSLRLSHKSTGYGSTWIAWDTWTTLEVKALFSLLSFIAHPVSQSIDDSHRRLTFSVSGLTVCRSDLVLGCGSVCAASSHCVATGHFSPNDSPRQQRRWCRSRWPRWPRQCPSRHLSTTRQRSSSPRRAENTVPHECLASQTLQVQFDPCLCISLYGLININPTLTIMFSPILSELNVFANKVPNRRTTARFKHTVPRLFDRLARDALQPARKVTSRSQPCLETADSHSLEGRHRHWQYQC